MEHYILSILSGILTAAFTFYSIKVLWGFNFEEIGEALSPSYQPVTPDSGYRSEQSIPDYAELVYAGRAGQRPVVKKIGGFDHTMPVIEGIYLVITRENSAVFGHRIYLN